MQSSTPQNRSPQCARKVGPRIIQRRVTGQDFNLFHAIVGSQPILEPSAAERNAVEAMATPPLHEEPVEAMNRKPKRRLVDAGPRPVVLKRIRELCQRGISLRVKRPDMAQWLRLVSDAAFRRMEEAQTRLLSTPRAIPTPPPEQRAIMRYNKVA